MSSPWRQQRSCRGQIPGKADFRTRSRSSPPPQAPDKAPPTAGVLGRGVSRYGVVTAPATPAAERARLGQSVWSQTAGLKAGLRQKRVVQLAPHRSPSSSGAHAQPGQARQLSTVAGPCLGDGNSFGRPVPKEAGGRAGTSPDQGALGATCSPEGGVGPSSPGTRLRCTRRGTAAGLGRLAAIYVGGERREFGWIAQGRKADSCALSGPEVVSACGQVMAVQSRAWMAQRGEKCSD